ncbi:hypothetical protein [uncultured Chryseobacterium sp.]|uniref:DUF6705 family protein n=1 Tax=uncultured Chryseobacterium sp. TaxID=259322 RepID=UPI0025F1F00E|nr:hypothetical protein [uncultured Chryseobacterium sp.]
MKNLIIFLITCTAFICKAQHVYPLNTDFTTIPNYSYVKDMDNELDQLVGNYKADFEGRQISLFITKQPKKLIHLGNRKFYQDVLSIRYQIKNSSGLILQDTQNMNFQSNQFEHTIYSTMTRPTSNVISFTYGGTNCGIGWGDIYLKKLNSTQISWEYIPDSTIIDSRKCPPGTDTTIYLPETKDLIFTKQ